MKNIIRFLRKKVRNYFFLHTNVTKLMAITQNQSNEINLLNNLKSFDCFKTSQKEMEITTLLNLLKTKEFRTICEIGSFRGGTFYLFCQAAEDDATLISVDIDYPIERKYAHKKFAKKRQKVFCVRGDTKDPKTFKKVKKDLNGQQIDLLFIDGDHSLIGVMNDFVRFEPLVSKKGVIAIHDIKSNPSRTNAGGDEIYVGDVPLFWQMINQTNMQTMEIIEDSNQDGYGIGVIFKDLK